MCVQANLGIVRNQGNLSPQIAGPALNQHQIQFAELRPAPLGPDQEDPSGLAPAELVANRADIIIRLELEYLSLHRGVMLAVSTGHWPALKRLTEIHCSISSRGRRRQR